MLTGGTFDDVRAWILTHHERPDGTGYPRGLRGEQIPLVALTAARELSPDEIIAVVDAYEAMTSERAYRAAMSHEEACAELGRHSGTQFDPLVVTAFLGAVGLYRRRHVPLHVVRAA